MAAPSCKDLVKLNKFLRLKICHGYNNQIAIGGWEKMKKKRVGIYL